MGTVNRRPTLSRWRHDPENPPDMVHALGVNVCRECGALVLMYLLVEHEDWHDKIDERLDRGSE